MKHQEQAADNCIKAILEAVKKTESNPNIVFASLAIVMTLMGENLKSIDKPEETFADAMNKFLVSFTGSLNLIDQITIVPPPSGEKI